MNSFAILSEEVTLLLMTIFWMIIIILSVVIVSSRTNIGKIYASSALSTVICCVYLLLDSPDVALTEASIGACISTVIFLVFDAKLKDKETEKPNLIRFLLGAIAGVSILVLFISLDKLLPEFGNIHSPINLHANKYYLENTVNDIGIPAFVTAILASYRGFDTFGETTVILIAGVAVCLILGIKDEKKH